MSKKLYEYQLNKVNPFLEETVHHVEKGEKVILLGTNNDILVDGETGKVKAHSLFARRTPIDRAQFAKIYISSLAAWFDLSKTGIRIFTYIIDKLSSKPNSDSFMMNYEECMNFTGYKSKKSISDGIKELIENQFIARGENQYIYFINPTVFFNGNRITFLEQYEVKDEVGTIKEIE